MAPLQPILLFGSDAAFLSSLEFALALSGFAVAEGSARAASPAAAALVIDQAQDLDGLALLSDLRSTGLQAPALLLATNPTRALRARAQAAGAKIVEKPLLGDELIRTLTQLNSREAP